LFTLEKSNDIKYIKDILNEKEVFYINMYDTYINGYNSTLGGEGSLGNKLTEEHIQIIKDSKIGVLRSQETKDKISNSLKGREISQETKLNMSKVKIGTHHTEETKKKMSETKKGISPSKGAIQRSIEVRQFKVYQFSKDMEFIKE
jgi:hypothetical protein